MAISNSTANQYAPTAQDVYQSRIIFSELADMALRVRYLLAEVVAAASDPDLGNAVELAAAARHLVERMGWAADLGSGKLDGTGRGDVWGGAEDWLMPPAYFSKQGGQS